MQARHAEQGVVEHEAHVVRVRRRRAAHDGEDRRLGRRLAAGPPVDPRHLRRRRSPALAQALQDRQLDLRPGEVDRAAVGRQHRPVVERRHRQHAVGLATDPQHRQRSLGAHVGQRVGAGRGRLGQHREEVLEEVAARRRPQQRLHRLGTAVARGAGAGDRGDGRRVDAERGRQRRRAVVGAPRSLRSGYVRAGSRRAGVPGRSAVAVVRRRADGGDRDALGVAVRSRGGRRARAASSAGSGVARSPVTTSVSNPNVMSSTVSGTRIAMPMSSAAWKSTSQRMPGSTVTASSGGGRRRRCRRVGPDVEVGGHRCADPGRDPRCRRDGRGPRSARGAAGRSAPVSTTRRVSACSGCTGGRGSGDVVGERLVRAVGGVRRGQRRDDPRRPALVVALGELLPDPQPALHRGRVVATTRPPRLVPEVPAPRDLVGRQLGLVGVDVELVGIDAHPQLGVGGVDHEAGLDAQRQEDDRQVDVREAPEQEQLVGFGQGHGRSRVTAGSPGR